MALALAAGRRWQGALGEGGSAELAIRSTDSVDSGTAARPDAGTLRAHSWRQWQGTGR